MSIDLAVALPELLPKAIEWAEAQSNHVLSTGSRLSETGIRLAQAVGVAQPERIRVGIVSMLPLPDDPELQAAALQSGLLGPEMTGLTLGYGIYICDGHASNRLISHECRHVYQFESAGSISEFLPIYLHQIVTYGYHDAPFEVDARAHEVNVA